MRGSTFPAVFFSTFGLLIFCGCSGNSDTSEDLTTVSKVEEFSIATSPEEDFYTYVNEKWLSNTLVPGDFQQWNILNELEVKKDQILFSVLTKSSSEVPYEEYSDEWKAAEFYSIGMDSLKSEQFAVQPIAEILSRIQSIRSINQLANFLIFQEGYQTGGFFRMSIKPDPSKENRLWLHLQGIELGLEKNSNYTSQDEDYGNLRRTYLHHISKMLELSGLPFDSTVCSAILRIESQIATGLATRTDKDLEEERSRYLSAAELEVLSPSINWSVFISSMGVEIVDSVIVDNVEILRVFESILSDESMNDIKSFLSWQLVKNSAPYLHHALVAEDFAFTSFLHGKKHLPPRENRVLASVNEYVGEAVGKLYVGRAFSPKAKREAHRLVNNLKISFANRIKQLAWMNDSTKLLALDRLRTLRIKIGYPDSWKNYSELIVDRGPELGSYWQNVMNGRLFKFEQQISSLRQPIDSGSWQISPQTVELRYDAGLHELVVPAAILQQPLFDENGDRVANYGSIGALISREMSKVLDSIHLILPMEQPDSGEFATQRQKLVQQYRDIWVLDSIPLNAEAAAIASVADLAGFSVAFEGLKRSLRDEGGYGVDVDKRFIIAWTRIWRSKYEEEFLVEKVGKESYVPEWIRANIALSNQDQFYSNFDISPLSKMYIADSLRSKIW